MRPAADDVIEFANALCEHSPRMWENEAEAASLIRDRLTAAGIDFIEQEYDVVYPEYPVYELTADGQDIECLPSGFESGTVDGDTIIDNVAIAHGDFDGANINFNPQCEGLSKQTFYEAPALTVARSDIGTILAADEVEGRLEVEWSKYTSRNFIVGNTDNPELVIFTHYDSWWGGFVDNAFSVSLLLHLAPHIDLDRVCIVFAGSEEVSHEEQYWCYGYRQFEKRYFQALDACDRIAVVDTVGRGETQVVSDDDFLLGQALVLHNRDYVEKTELFIGEFDRIMEIYHSPLDTEEALTHPDDGIDRVIDGLADYLNG